MRTSPAQTPHSRFPPPDPLGVFPGRQLHEREFGALPLTPVPKDATPFHDLGFYPFIQQELRPLALAPPSRAPHSLASLCRPGLFQTRLPENQECGAHIPRPDTTFPFFERAPRRFPWSSTPREGIWCTPPRLSAKGRNPLFATWAFTPSPNRNCVLWHWHPNLEHNFASHSCRVGPVRILILATPNGPQQPPEKGTHHGSVITRAGPRRDVRPDHRR